MAIMVQRYIITKTSTYETVKLTPLVMDDLYANVME